MYSSMPDWLSRQAQTQPHKQALIADDVSWTYHQLLHHSLSVKTMLVKAGVVPQDRVAVYCRKASSFVLAVHALMQSSAILVPLNRKLPLSELAFQIQDAQPSAILVDAEQKEQAEQLMEAAGLQLPVLLIENGLNEEAHIARQSFLLTDKQAIIYTSGTTGLPKGAVLTYRSQWFSAVSSALHFGLQKNDIWLMPMPLFHVGGLASILRAVIYGSTLWAQDRFVAADVLVAMENENVTLLSLVPTMLQAVLQEAAGRPIVHHLRALLVGGSGAPPALLQKALEAGLPVCQSFGMSEANSTVTVTRDEQSLLLPGCAGQPLSCVQVAIFDEQGQQLPPNASGEIRLAGPTMSEGYWNRPEATDQAFQDGFFCTGDLGWIDEEGRLFVLDRRSDLILVGGENVYPAEIERVLRGCEKIVDVGVIGISDEKYGQVPAAFIVVNGPWTEAEFYEYAKPRLATYQCPKVVRFVDELPRNASGKLLRRKLREQWQMSEVR